VTKLHSRRAPTLLAMALLAGGEGGAAVVFGLLAEMEQRERSHNLGRRRRRGARPKGPTKPSGTGSDCLNLLPASKRSRLPSPYLHGADREQEPPGPVLTPRGFFQPSSVTRCAVKGV
jgi:hypothetical protein